MPLSCSASGVASFSLRCSCIKDRVHNHQAFSIWTAPQGFNKPQNAMPVYVMRVDERRANSDDFLLVGRGSFEVLVELSRPDVAIASATLLPEGTRDVMHWECSPEWMTIGTDDDLLCYAGPPSSTAILRVEYGPAERAEHAPDDDRFVIKRHSERVCNTNFLYIYRLEPLIASFT